MDSLGNRLKQRQDFDTRAVERNERVLGDVISGRAPMYVPNETPTTENIRQIGLIAQYFNLPIPTDVRTCDDVEEQIDAVLQQTGIMRRNVRLDGRWWQNGDGVLLAVRSGTNDLVALFPQRLRGYYYVDERLGNKVPVSTLNQSLFERDAFCLYEPLPAHAMKGQDYLAFLCKRIRPADVAMAVLSTLLVSLVGALTPLVTREAFVNIIPSGKPVLMASLLVMLLSCAVGGWLFRSVRYITAERIKGRLEVIAQNAVYARVLNLPAQFFSAKSVGGVSRCVEALNEVPQYLTEALFYGVPAVCSAAVYAVTIGFIAEDMVLPILGVLAAELVLMAWSVAQESRILRNELIGAEHMGGMVYNLIDGIQKIKVSGSENRAFARWMEGYAAQASTTFAVRFPSGALMELVRVLQMTGMLASVAYAHYCGLSVAEFIAYSSAYGLVMTSVDAIALTCSDIARLGPLLELGEPILEQEPELAADNLRIRSLTGSIVLNNVSFRYSNSAPAVLDDVSLTIQPGEYVGVVGTTGCGKSTLLKLLLGFEECQKGTIYYDGIEIDRMDKRSLRQCIGAVLQDDKLFAGDVFSNITISAPWLTLDDAWRAAEAAGIADDIRSMPMGMNTLLSDGGGGVSGGQRQRIIIARALAAKPSILMFDEATSALDNVTQKIVTDTLNALECTRIVIAHRLSTIQSCDRILVLNGGKIVEDGTYEELIQKDGFFAYLVSRQQV